MDFEDEILKINEDMISEQISENFKNRFINVKEKFACPLYEGKCILICYVDKITPINVKSNFTYGIIQSAEDTDICVKASNQKVLKIVSNRMQEKQVFKKNMNF